ncbi:MAG: DUF1223 domain-containing protein [Janthinobacterium lividum]
MRYSLFACVPLAALAANLVPAAAPAPAGRVPVVVELFTSEGCSSCPAADEVLRELESTQPVPGVEVIALGQHVDYWNRLGWADPFSSPQFTSRQRWYATGFTESNYTPQAVIDGRYELVGSRRQQLIQTLAAAAHAPQAMVALVRPTANTLQVSVRNLPAGTSAATVQLALAETGLSTQVGRGENAGHLLRHAAVVRSLLTLGPVGADGTFSATVPLNLATGWQPNQLRAVVLVQEATSHHVVGVASVPLGTLVPD